MRAVRRTDRKIVVHIGALVAFLEEFRASSMLPAIVALCDQALEDPAQVRFLRENPEPFDRWLEADIATDLLYDFFLAPQFPPDDLDGVHKVTVNPARGTITIHLPRDEWPLTADGPDDVVRPPAPPDPAAGSPDELGEAGPQLPPGVIDGLSDPASALPHSWNRCPPPRHRRRGGPWGRLG